MKQFNNSEYEAMVKDFLGDTFYTETSYRGKIATLRSCAEVIVRKLLDLKPKQKMTLGNFKIEKKIKELPNIPNSDIVLNAIGIINSTGSDYTHTQKTNEATKDEFNNAVNSVMDLLSVLLINYFEKYEFGTKNEVMYSFSILPPIIRYKVLSALYEKYPNNISLIDKLVLSILKAFNTDTAILWVEERKEVLNKLKTISEKAVNEISENMGSIAAIQIQNALHSNMYELCKYKIFEVGKIIAAKGCLYSNFESALPIYKENGILPGDEPEIVEFNDIMNFLYLGRKENLIDLPKDSNSYIIMNFIS